MMAMRFPFAIEKVYSQEERDDPKTAPALQRKHVFDFEGGLRLIISRDDLGEKLGILFHVSGSVWRADRLPNLNKQYWGADQATWMVGELNKIAQVEPKFIKTDLDLVASSTSPQGVVHLFFRDLEERRREPGA
jgi:hypothetical protein